MEEIKHLTRLRPAETLFIIDGRNASLQNLLKYTLLDLLFRNVLKTVEISRQPNPRDEVRIYKYVTTGTKYFDYPGFRYESAFLRPFGSDPDARVLFRHIVKLGYEHAGTQNKYQNMVAMSPAIQDCVKRNFVQRLIGEYSFTHQRILLSEALKKEIDYLREVFPQMLKTDRDRALNLMHSVGGNYFIFSTLDLELLELIDGEFATLMRRKHGTDSGVDSGCGGWDGFEENSSDFDSSCSSDSGGGSGCSGGGGCSGCGGCGGCGGCS